MKLKKNYWVGNYFANNLKGKVSKLLLRFYYSENHDGGVIVYKDGDREVGVAEVKVLNRRRCWRVTETRLKPRMCLVWSGTNHRS